MIKSIFDNSTNTTPEAPQGEIKSIFNNEATQEAPQGSNVLEGGVSMIQDFGDGIVKGVSSLGTGLGKNITNKYLRPIFGKDPLSDEQLDEAYGSLDDKPKSTAGKVGKVTGEILPYFLLPQVEPIAGGGAAASVGNMAINGAYQGGLATGLDSLANKGISKDLLKDTVTGIGTGALLNTAIGGAVKYGIPKLANKVAEETAFDAIKAIKPQVKEIPYTQSVSPEGGVQLNAGLVDNEPIIDNSSPVQTLEKEISKEDWQKQKAPAKEPVKDPEFINTDGLKLKKGTDFLNLNSKSVIDDIRSAYSGDKNSNIVRINQLADDVKKIVPDKTQREALTFYKEAGGDVTKLQDALNSGNPVFEPYRKQMQQAIDATPEMQKANAVLEQYYKEAGDTSVEHGFLDNLRRNYINRIWEREPITGGKSIPSLNRINGHIQKRQFSDLLEGINAGMKPASLDASDLMTVHGSEFSRTLANNKLVNALESVGLGEWKHPGDTFVGDAKFAEIERNIPRQRLEKGENGEDLKIPELDKNGNQIIDKKIFTTPDWLAKGMKSITDPNYLNQIDELRGLHKYQAFVKTVDLSMSLFHDFTFTMQWAYQHKFNPMDTKEYFSALKNVDKFTDSADFKLMERDFVEHTGITSKVQQNVDVLSKMSTKNPSLQKFLDAPGVKQVIKANEAHSNYLFGKMQRWLKVADYAKKCSTWLEKNPKATNDQIVTAKRSMARQINAAYGGLNWETLGATPSMVRIGQLGLLAPDWTYSNIELAKTAFHKSAAGDLSRSHIASALIGGGIITESLNKFFTGHYTDGNAKGHQFEVEVRPGVYISFFRGGIGDFLKLGSNVAENGVGGVGQFANGKLSPIMRAGTTALSGRNYFGQKVTTNGPLGKGKHLNGLQKSGNYFAAIGQNGLPIPFAANSAFTLSNSKKTKPNVIDYGLTMSGLARTGKPSKRSK